MHTFPPYATRIKINAMVSRPGVVTIQIISNMIMLVHITIFALKKKQEIS